MLRFARKIRIREEWKPLAACLALSLVSACTGSNPDTGAHKPAPAPAEITSPNPADLSPKIVADQQVAELQGSVKALDYDPYKQVIQPLRASFFNTAVLLNAQLQGTQRDELLRLYNRAVLDYAKQVTAEMLRAKSRRDANDGEMVRWASAFAAEKKLAAVLDEYENMVTLGCDKKAWVSGCRLVQTFRDVSSSWDVWNLILDRDTHDLERLEKRLRFGFRLVNDRESTKVRLRYLKESPRIEKALEARRIRDREREELHYNRVERLLRDSEGIRDSAEYTGYLRYLLEEETQEKAPGRRDRIRQDLIKAGANGDLLKTDWFLAGLAKAAEEDPEGYVSRVKLLNERGKAALSNFGVRPSEIQDPFLLLLDNVYSSRWSASTAFGLWKKSRPSAAESARMQKLIADFVRTMVVAMVVESNGHMGDFYADRELFRSSKIHIRAYEISELLKGRWVDLYTRVDRLRGFAYMIFGNGPEVSEMRIDQSALNEAVSFLVAYPHMMMMAYQMVKHKFHIKGYFSSIDAGRVLGDFFEGKIGESWFDYTMSANGIRKFDPTELVYVYHYALKTDAFATMGIDPDDFLKTVVSELLKTKLIADKKGGGFDYGLLDHIRFFNDQAAAFNVHLEDAKRFCSEERRADELKARRNGPSATFQRSYVINVDADEMYNGFIPYSDFGYLVLGTLESDRKERGSPLSNSLYHGLDFIANTHEEGMEHVRYTLGEFVNYSRDLISVYRRHLETLGMEKREIDTRVAKVSEPLEEMKHDLRRYYTLVFGALRDFVLPCKGYILRKEFDMQNEVIRYEYEHLKQVYRDYHKLKRIKSSGVPGESVFDGSEELEAARILSRYRVDGFGKQNYYGFDHFELDKGDFAAFRLDSVFRFERYMREGLVTDTVRLPPINNAIRLRLPVEGLKGLAFFEHPKPVHLKVEESESEDAFARQYISLMRGQSTTEGMEFANFHLRSDFWAKNLHRNLPPVLASLMKTGKVEIYAPGQPECLAAEQPEGCKVQATELSNKEMATSIFFLYDFISGTEEDIAVMKLIGLRNRGEIANFGTTDDKKYFYDWGAGLLFHPHTRLPLGFFDHQYLYVENTRLGFKKQLPWDPPAEGGMALSKTVVTMSSFERAMQLYKFRSGERLHMFKPDLELGAFLSREYGARADHEFWGLKRVEQTAKEAEAADKAAGYARRYRVPNRQGEWVGGTYLTRRLVVDGEIREEDFHRDTRNLFRKFQLPQE